MTNLQLKFGIEYYPNARNSILELFKKGIIDHFQLSIPNIQVSATISFLVGSINFWFAGKIGSKIVNSLIIYIVPIVFILFSIIFNLNPTFFTFIIVTIFMNLYYTLFNTVDTNYRLALNRQDLVEYNVEVTKKFSIAQIMSCFIALLFYSFDYPSKILSILIFLSFVTAIFLIRFNRTKAEVVC